MTNLHAHFSVEPASVQPHIRIVTTGFWQPDVADRYLLSVDHSVKLMRQQYGYVRALVDARTAAIHPKETIERLKPFCNFFRGPSDRIAIIVASILKKQQVVRGIAFEKGKVFLSVEAAENWLDEKSI